jgi:hypothetical protein
MRRLTITFSACLSDQPCRRLHAVHAELVAAGYTSLEADTLVQEVLERMAEQSTYDLNEMAPARWQAEPGPDQGEKGPRAWLMKTIAA